jgi:signal peptidase II
MSEVAAALIGSQLLVIVVLALFAWQQGRDRAWMACAAVVVFGDQATKCAIRAFSQPGDNLVLGNDAFYLYHLHNTNMAGGSANELFARLGLPWGPAVDILLCGLGLALIYAALYLILRRRRIVIGSDALVGLGLIVGGGFSNLLDRVLLGGVTDFIALNANLVCNLADFAVTTGGLIVAGACIYLAAMMLHGWYHTTHRPA